MNLLLLSWGAGALPGFLTEHTGREPAATRLGYLDDAMLPFADSDFVEIDRYRLVDLGYAPITVTARDIGSTAEFAAILDDLDALYVCGGETFVLLANLRRHGLDEVLAAKVRAGLPYIGLSAGAVIAGQSIEPVSTMDDPASAPDLTDYRGLGLVDTSVIPHADGRIELFPPALIAETIQTYSPRFDLTLLHDDQALLVHDDQVTVVEST